MQGACIQARQRQKQRRQVAVELHAPGIEDRQRPADAAFRQPRRERAIGVGQICRARRDEPLDGSGGQRAKVEAPAARTDGGQKPAGRMADQQQHGARRRLFQHLQQSVLGVAVHILRAIDDDDAPAALRRREPQEGDRVADIVDDDLAAQLSGLGIDRPRQDPEIRMAAAGDAPEDRMLRIQVQAGGRGRCEQRVGLTGFAGQQKTGEAIGQRRLADTLGTGQEPGMGQPARASALEKGALGGVLIDQRRIFPRLHQATSSPSLAFTAALTPAQVAASSPVASMTTQRSGAAAAMARKPCRNASWKRLSILS